MTDEKLQKMLDTNVCDGSGINFIDQSAEEAKVLRRTWYTHFLNVLEKLADELDSLSSEFHENKFKMFKELNEAKDSLRKEMSIAKAKGDIDLEKLESRIEKSIDALNTALSTTDRTKDVECLRREIANVKFEMIQKIEDMISEHEKEVSNPMKETLTAIKTKIAIWTVLSAMVISGSISFIIWLLQDYIKKYFVG